MEISDEFGIDLRDFFANLLVKNTVAGEDRHFCVYCLSLLSSKFGETTFNNKIKISDNVYINISEINEIKHLIKLGQKINAIKQFREMTGMGLKESKEFVDRLELSSDIYQNVSDEPF